jgi:hypothetical protein
MYALSCMLWAVRFELYAFSCTHRAVSLIFECSVMSVSTMSVLDLSSDVNARSRRIERRRVLVLDVLSDVDIATCYVNCRYIATDLQSLSWLSLYCDRFVCFVHVIKQFVFLCKNINNKRFYLQAWMLII